MHQEFNSVDKQARILLKRGVFLEHFIIRKMKLFLATLFFVGVACATPPYEAQVKAFNKAKALHAELSAIAETQKKVLSDPFWTKTNPVQPKFLCIECTWQVIKASSYCTVNSKKLIFNLF